MRCSAFQAPKTRTTARCWLGRRVHAVYSHAVTLGSASRPSGEWDDYDVLAGGRVGGQIVESAAAPVGPPWMGTAASGQHEDRTATHGYAETREAAMGAFAKSWRRE